MDHDEQLAELEKQLAGLEKQVSAVLSKQAKDKPRFRPGVNKAEDVGGDEDEVDGEDEDDFEDLKEEKRAPKVAKADKAEKVEKADKSDETITIAGETISKNAVGDAQFKIFKAQAEELKKAQEAIAKERDLRLTAELQKRADDVYPHVSGTTEERGEMLKAMSAMDEKTRGYFEKALAQAEKLSGIAFEKLGSNGGGKGPANGGDFEKKLGEIRKRDNCDRITALQKARQEFPEEFKAYQASAN